MKCKRCGSYAINHKLHGRDGADPDLCDVCYWRKRAEEEKPEFIEVREFLRRTYDGRLYADSITNGHNCTPDEAEKLTSFIKWIDKDWRKVEI